MRLSGIMLLLGLSAGLTAQEIIENPAGPVSERAGRTVMLEEVMRIKDGGSEDFYFRNPHSIYVSPRGDVLVRDWDQLLFFDEGGRFKANLFKKGRGPGEMNYVGGCLPGEDDILIYSGRPSKLMRFDYGGRLIEEIPLRNMPRFLTLIHRGSEVPVFVSWEWPVIEKAEGYAASPHVISRLDVEKGSLLSLAEFPVRKYILRSRGGGGAIFDISRMMAAPITARRMALSHTGEYLVKVLDLETGDILRSFRRDYPRVIWDRSRERGKVMVGGRTGSMPPQKFENDIVNLLADSGRIWVMTSTRRKDGAVLIDVYTSEGRLIDQFHMRNPAAGDYGQLGFFDIALSGGYVYTLEKDEKEISSIAKYRLKGI